MDAMLPWPGLESSDRNLEPSESAELLNANQVLYLVRWRMLYQAVISCCWLVNSKRLKLTALITIIFSLLYATERKYQLAPRDKALMWLLKIYMTKLFPCLYLIFSRS